MTMVFGTMSHRSSGLTVSLDGTLESFTFACCSSVDFIACAKDIGLDFLS